jgi:hypothetical protein
MARSLAAEVIMMSGRRLWWDPNNVGLSVIGAYRAIATPGSPWPLAPTNYADTLQDWSGASPNLTEGNGAVPHNLLTGWAFVAAALQYFDTSLVPANDLSWSAFIQFDGASDNAYLFGQDDGVNRDFSIRPSAGGGVLVAYANGTQRNTFPALSTGNLGLGGAQPYRDGVSDGPPTGAWAGASVSSIYIGCRNNGGVSAGFITSNIRAVALYSANPAAVQGQASAIATAMSQL